MAANVAQMAAMMQTMQLPSVRLPTPPAFVGALLPNQWLSKANKFVENKVFGLESMVVVGGYVYTGMQNGWVVEVMPNGTVRNILRLSSTACGVTSLDEKTCGRPMGIRRDPNSQMLIVADAYKGIYRINVTVDTNPQGSRGGRYWQLVDGSQLVNGKRLGFINDLVVARDGTMFFTSSSTKYDRTKEADIILDGETTGRVLVYNPRAAVGNRVQELVSSLHFPNGLELSKDESYLLIAEGARARIHKAWVGANTAKRYTIELFAENLPGFVDNIRRSPRDTYWVAISSSRSKDAPSVLDRYGSQPQLRSAIMGLSRDQVNAQSMSKHGLVIELDKNGQIIRSLHDPAGRLYTSVSEVDEENGILYIASKNRNFIGWLRVSNLPALYVPGADPPSALEPTTTQAPTTPPAVDTDNKLVQLLTRVRANTDTMSRVKLQDTVHILLQRLVEARVAALRAVERANLLQVRLNAVTAASSSATTDASTAAAGASTAAGDTTTSPSSAANLVATTRAVATTTTTTAATVAAAPPPL